MKLLHLLPLLQHADRCFLALVLLPLFAHAVRDRTLHQQQHTKKKKTTWILI